MKWYHTSVFVLSLVSHLLTNFEKYFIFCAVLVNNGSFGRPSEADAENLQERVPQGFTV